MPLVLSVISKGAGPPYGGSPPSSLRVAESAVAESAHLIVAGAPGIGADLCG
jgi:hypothetical protein